MNMNVSRFSTSFQGKHIWYSEALLQSHTKRVSWWSFLIFQVPMKATWLPLNTVFHALNTVWVSKTTRVFLIDFCFPHAQASIKSITLTSWCISWISGYHSSLVFSWDWSQLSHLSHRKWLCHLALGNWVTPYWFKVSW